MTDVGILFDHETRDDGDETVDKRDFLIKNRTKLPKKITEAKLRKLSNDAVEELFNEFQEGEAQCKAEMTGKAVSKHVINLYATGVSKMVKLDSIEKLRMDIDNDPIIKESMADVGALLVGTFGRFLAPILFLAHTANHTKGFVEEEAEPLINERQASE